MAEAGTEAKVIYEHYQAALRKLLDRELGRQEIRERRGLKLAQECARLLGERFGATKVYLFGSLAEGLFWEDSDIDLAVEGMSLEQYLKALAELRVTDDIHLDLVHLDYCRPVLRERILKGDKLKILYDHDSNQREGSL